MSIETEIKGSPSSVRRAGDWVGSTLRPAIDDGLSAFGDARTEAAGDWRGEAGSAFEGAMGRAITETRPLERSAADVRTTFLDYAGSLESCQNRMKQIRADARSAGLTVSGYVVESPGAGPARPGDPPMDASQGQIDSYNRVVDAYNAHQDKVTAYNALVTRADEVWADMERAWERVSAQNRAMDGPGWAFQLSDVAGGLGGALMDVHASALRGNAQYFADLSADYLQRMHQSAPTGRVPSALHYYDDLDHWNRIAGESADELSRAARLANVGRFAPIALGGVLAVGGGFYDYHVKGESAEQAIASNAGGFAASVATGAVVGTMIGGPVGTVVGCVVGAGVGVFTSGMIDGLWEHDGDVSDAFMAGVDSVVDTGEALADVGGAIVDGIGGLFD
ncbi:hypothetical protein [Nocardioides astragali]|uniref:WXG100 family type VII secretion target n=1 Tax=Nocardioides astragali TaxID=1776736 RepID=A0ABW2MX87_9ACTN|nr:hypothetical protein [Nocardioides astragali]